MLKRIPFLNALTDGRIIDALRNRGIKIPKEPDLSPEEIVLSVGDVLYVPRVTVSRKKWEDKGRPLPNSARITFIRYEVCLGTARPRKEDIIPMRVFVNPGIIPQPGTIRSSSSNGLLKDVDPERVFFTADTHFFDGGVLKHRPVSRVLGK